MEFAPNLDIIINETLPALQKVKEAGKARFIGITGYPMENFRWCENNVAFTPSMGVHSQSFKCCGKEVSTYM